MTCTSWPEPTTSAARGRLQLAVDREGDDQGGAGVGRARRVEHLVARDRAALERAAASRRCRRSRRWPPGGARRRCGGRRPAGPGVDQVPPPSSEPPSTRTRSTWTRLPSPDWPTTHAAPASASIGDLGPGGTACSASTFAAPRSTIARFGAGDDEDPVAVEVVDQVELVDAVDHHVGALERLRRAGSPPAAALLDADVVAASAPTSLMGEARDGAGHGAELLTVVADAERRLRLAAPGGELAAGRERARARTPPPARGSRARRQR